MSTPENVSDDLLKQLAEGAAALRAAGESLTKRINHAETWLSELPGRVEAWCTLWSHDDGSDTRLNLQRDGKFWVLYTYDYNEMTESVSNDKPLRDASIIHKARALEQLPALLEAMVKSQQSLTTAAERAVNSYDAFAKSMAQKEGA